MTSYINKHGVEILVDDSGWRISREKLNQKFAAVQAAQAAKKAPQSLLRELEAAKADGESPEYIAYLEAKIAKYAHP